MAWVARTGQWLPMMDHQMFHQVFYVLLCVYIHMNVCKRYWWQGVFAAKSLVQLTGSSLSTVCRECDKQLTSSAQHKEDTLNCIFPFAMALPQPLQPMNWTWTLTSLISLVQLYFYILGNSDNFSSCIQWLDMTGWEQKYGIFDQIISRPRFTLVYPKVCFSLHIVYHYIYIIVSYRAINSFTFSSASHHGFTFSRALELRQQKDWTGTDPRPFWDMPLVARSSCWL